MSDTDKKQRCGAKTRSGEPCQNWGMANGKCRLHGGKSVPGGTTHHSFKHGIYSRFAHKSIKDVLEQLEDVDTEELIKPESEIRLFSALVMKARAIENGVEDLQQLNTLSRILERLILAKQRSQSILQDQNRLINVQDVEIFLSFMEELLIKKVGETNTFEIMNKLKSFRISDHEN